MEQLGHIIVKLVLSMLLASMLTLVVGIAWSARDAVMRELRCIFEQRWYVWWACVWGLLVTLLFLGIYEK